MVSAEPYYIATHATCRLTAKNRDQLRNPTLGNGVWATFTFTFYHPLITRLKMQRGIQGLQSLVVCC